MIKKISFSAILLAIIFFSMPTTFAVTCEGDFEEQAGVCFPVSSRVNLPSSDVATIVTNAMNWLLAIVGIMAVIAFAISGIQYILSTGDEKTIDTAKRNMKWSIVGVVVALSGLVIINAAVKFLDATPDF